MKRVLTILGTLLHPPGWAAALAAPAAFAALVYVFVTGRETHILAYPVYAVSAYCLTVLALALPTWIRRAKAAVLRRITGTAFGRRYLRDLAFRGSVSIYQGMAVNFFYVAFRITAAIRYASVWFLSMAVYYLVLGGLRSYLIVCYRRSSPELERRCYHTAAWMLFLLNIPMGGMIALMVWTNSGFSYPGSIIYLSALYAFYAVTISVINLVRFRRLGSPILSAAKVLNLISAMMSILGLQTAMIARFSENGARFRMVMNAVTGGCVYGAVIVIAGYMLLRSSAWRKQVGPVEEI